MTETIQATITPRAGRLLQRIGRAIIVLIELKYWPAACDSTFCKPIPYVSVRAADEPPQRGFVRTLSGDVQIFLQERLAKLAVDKKTSIGIDATGFWKRKRHRATGLDPYLI
jgi:hypothetical protein